MAGADAIAVDVRSGRVFATCGACSHGVAGTVRILDAQTGATLRSVPVGPSPLAVAVDTTTERVFVTNQGARSVSILDTHSGSVLRTVPIAGDPDVVAVAERVGRVFVTDANANNLSVLDARTGAVLHSFNLRGGPFSMAVAERTGRLFVGAWQGHSISMLDARSGTVLHTLRVTGTPNALAVDEQSGHVFVASGEMLDARTGVLLRTIAFGGLTLTVDGPTRRAFATTPTSVDVLDIQSSTVVHSVNVPTSPTSVPVVIDHAGRVAVLLNSPADVRTSNLTGPGQLLVLDGRTGAVLRRITVGDVMTFGLYNVVAADVRTKRLFVLDGDGVRVFDTARL